MKILITGGAGFIGNECARQSLALGHQVVVMDKLTYAGDLARLEDIRDDLCFYHCDIVNREFVHHVFKHEKPDAVIHWAAETHVDRSIIDANPFMDTNVKGTQILLDAAKRFGIGKFINIATDEVYGDLGRDGEFLETTPLSPNSPYSVSKTSADMMGRAYFRTYQLPVVTIRPSNNYGAWQYPEKLLPVIIYKATHGDKIPVYGKGDNVREWLHVSDCVRGVLTVLEKAAPGAIFNIGSRDEKTNIEVIEHILGLLEGHMPTLAAGESRIQFVKDRPGHDFRYSVNTDRIRSELGWETKVTFEQGMKATVDWYLEHMSWVEQKIQYLQELWKRVY